MRCKRVRAHVKSCFDAGLIALRICARGQDIQDSLLDKHKREKAISNAYQRRAGIYKAVRLFSLKKIAKRQAKVRKNCSKLLSC